MIHSYGSQPDTKTIPYFFESIHIKTSKGKIVHIRKCNFCYNKFNFVFPVPPSWIILISLILLQSEGTTRMKYGVQFAL